jgi:small GTP-binding protein
MTEKLEGPLAALHEEEVDLLTDIAGTLAKVNDESGEDSKRLLDVAKDLREMFFLVAVIGEFNAGKSTFINALLGEELLPTGVTPTTEMIELVRYGETANRKPVFRDDSLREWSHPNTGAAGVAIVDTPGTGSIFERHEKTAKDFLHRSDLVIFLLSAKRAFAETERIYMEMAKNYGKKIILVVNQIDLLQSSEQATVRRFIETQVKEHLNLQPLLFMVSAKEALADGAGGSAGGVDAVRAHLRGVFAEAPPAKQKLISQLETAATVIKKYMDIVGTKSELVTKDTAKAHEVEEELKRQSLGLEDQLGKARGEIDNVFSGLRQRGINFIDSNLSIRKIGRTASKDKLQSEFQDVVIGRSLRDINEATGDYINAVVDQSRVYWRSVINRLNELVELLEQEIGGLDSNVYAEQRESLEEAIRIAEGELKTYSSGQLVNQIRQDFTVSMNGFKTSSLATFGGLIITLAALSAPGPVIGAGAAATASIAFVIAAPITALGGLAALRYYRRITSDLKNDFNARVDKLAKTYYTALDDLTRRERNRLTRYGSQVLAPIFSRLETLSKRYAQQQEQLETYQGRISKLRESIDRIESVRDTAQE